MFKGERITLMPGQLITGRKSIVKVFSLTESKVQRILKKQENEQQIEQQTSNKNRLITVLNWEQYQQSEQQIEQPVNNKRTTSEQQVNTNNNVNNENNEKIKEIVEYLNQKAGKNYGTKTAATKKRINARLKEGFTVNDFKHVIDVKCKEWSKTDMKNYLRPETLFGNKFESYLNQEPRRQSTTPRKPLEIVRKPLE